MQKKIIFLLLLGYCLSSSLHSSAQKNDFQHGLINVGIGSVIGGVGAVINKKQDESFGQSLLKGVAQGALGGYLIFESKRLVREFAKTRDYNYIWPSKIVNSAGASIIENAASNRDLWERWHLTFGFNRIEIDTKNNFRLSYRIMPFSLIGAIEASTKGNLDLERSLVFGTFVFTTNGPIGEDGLARGQASMNSILMKKRIAKQHHIAAHEIIHVYQYESFVGVNSFLDKPMRKWNEQNKYLALYNKIFYTDFNAGLMLGLYNWEKSTKGYYEVSFEKEASYFGLNYE